MIVVFIFEWVIEGSTSNLAMWGGFVILDENDFSDSVLFDCGVSHSQFLLHLPLKHLLSHTTRTVFALLV